MKADSCSLVSNGANDLAGADGVLVELAVLSFHAKDMKKP